ncbi:MAG: PAS domain S-box protein [Candidatus Lokiarchaeota archaeon]|nr:PAS domain S-box protein [Candidatus Lokiarchaeota archaeon]
MDMNDSSLFNTPDKTNFLFNAIPIPCFIWKNLDEEFILFDYNSSAIEKTKHKVEEIKHKKASLIFRDKPSILRNLNRCLEKKVSIKEELPYKPFTLEEKDFLQIYYEYLPPNSVMMFTKSIKKQKEIEKRYFKTGDKYMTLIQNLPLAVYSVFTDVNGTIEFMSKKFEYWTGYTLQELYDDPKLMYNIVHPKDRRRFVDEYIKAFKNKVEYSCEFRIIHKNSEEIRYILDHAIPIFSENGDITKYIGMVIDISEKYYIKKRLEESEEKFRKVAEQSSLGIQIVQDGELKFINEKALEFSGLKKDQVQSFDIKTLAKFIHPDDREKVVNQYNKRIKDSSKKYEPYEFKIVNKEREVFWVESQSKKIIYDDKEAELIILVDITDRKKIEQELKETANLFRSLAEQSSTGIQIVQNNILKYVNQKWADIFELELEDLMNKKASSMQKYIHQDDLEFIKKQMILRKINPEKAKNRYEFRGITSSGKVKWIDIFYKDITYKGKPASFITIVDITDKKHVQNELEQVSKLKSDFLRRITHELKTPLISIKGYADFLLEIYGDELPFDALRIARRINEGTKRLEDLIKELMEASKLESGKIELDLEKEDLVFLIKFTLRELQPLIEKRSHKIHLDLHDSLETFFEKEKIYEVLNNLISNAIKYTPENGDIYIKSEINDHSYIISIKDSGIGFTEVEKKLLFTQFGKIERYGQGLNLDINGSGLGLYISKELIELHEGKIWMESHGRNQGSTFYISIPIRKSN